MVDEPIIDPWSPLSFKRALGSKKTPGTSWAAPTWVGDHQRRLTAYTVLQSYIDNSSRFFLNLTDQNKIEEHREYGDAALLRDRVLAALLGEDQEIVVDDADETQDGELAPGAEQAVQLQEWLRDWAWTQERLGLKMIETERNAVGLGDGVYVLGIDHEKGRVRCRVFDPGFYFPVLDDGNEDEFPKRVHIAWEIEDPTDRLRKLVRRITWELVEGEDEILYPWNDSPTRWRCQMTDATWEINLNRGNTVDDFVGGRAEYKTYIDENGEEQELRDVDLGIDFLPVIHLPNTVAILDHYGRSVLATVLQILDDLANADTDLQASSATTGKPPIALSGATMVQSPTYKPGDVWAVGDGSATMIDTSKALVALTGYVEFLLKRLSTNARVPEAVLGRVDPSEIASGVLLALSFGPLTSMVKEMRLVRDEKYPLLLKFVWRMSVAAQFEDVPETWSPARVEFGSFLPTDQQAAVELVTRLLEAKAISLETAVQILLIAGLPIEDAVREIEQIESRDFEGANELLLALGDEAAVFEYLHRQQPPTTPPTPQPPVPGQPDEIVVPGTQRAEPTPPVAPRLPEA